MMMTFDDLYDYLAPDWKNVLKPFLDSDASESIIQELNKEIKNSISIFPSKDIIFKAFELTSFENTKVVILGQDPYHNDGQAQGLAFSVPPHFPIPPSLKNIYKELYTDVSITPPQHGCLINWAQQGVLLLNTALTVRAHEPMSHKHIGWEALVHEVIRCISQEKSHVVFILWGNQALKFEKNIVGDQHLIIKSAHPSPLSVRHGFYNSKPFSKTNNYLKAHGIAPINWQLDNTLF